MSTVTKVAIGCGGCLGVLIIGGIAVSALGLFGLGKVANEIDKDIKEQEQEDADKRANPHALNEEIPVENIVWKVTEASDKGSTLKATSSYGEDCVSSTGRFIQVKATVKNNTNEMKSLGSLNLYDKDGREYVNSSDIYGCVEDEFFLIDNINPGIAVEFIQTYEVPSDASGFYMEITDLNFLEDNKDYIGLGF